MKSGLAERSKYPKRTHYRLALALLSLYALGCTVVPPDFSMYVGVNLIPELGLENIADPTTKAGGWYTDQGTRDSVTGNLASSNIYMGFERLDNVAAGAAFLAASGFADSTALYATLPTDALNADGTNPAVYRLEVKNRFLYGDFEAAGLNANLPSSAMAVPGQNAGSAPLTGLRLSRITDSNSTPTTSITNTPAISGFEGNYLSTRLGPKEFLAFDLTDTSLFSSYDPSTRPSYNLSLVFATPGLSDLIIDWGILTGATPWSVQNPLEIKPAHISQATTNTATRFPFDSDPRSNNSELVASAESTAAHYLLFRGALSSQTMIIDNLQIVELSKSYGIRSRIPYRLRDSSQNERRPPLMQGGYYEVVVYVRNDPTALGASKALNRFPAESISISLSDQVGDASAGNAVAVTRSSASAWDSWTKLSIRFANLLNAGNLATTTDTQHLLMLTLTAMNINSNSAYIPGSLLISAPKLLWNPNS